MYVLENALEGFLDAVYVRSHSDETIRAYRNGVRKFEKFLHETYQSSLEEIVRRIRSNELDVYQILRDFVVNQDKLGFKPRTISLSVNAAKGYLRYCVIKIYSEDFKQVVRMPRKLPTNEIPLTKEVLLRLLRNVSPKLQTVILVATASGLRIGELAQLKVSDIDFKCNPTKLNIRAETTKTRTPRETFLTSEATNALKDYLKRYHGWDEEDSNSNFNDKEIFGRTSMYSGKLRQNSKLKYSIVYATKTLLQKSLETSIKKIPELNMKNADGIHVIHFHAFRKFFRTTVGNAIGRDFAEALMGHGFYMDTYYQLPEEKKRQMYLDAEPHLTISDFEKVEKNLKTLSSKYNALETKVDDLLQYLRTNSIQVPEHLIQ